jgi:membrane protein
MWLVLASVLPMIGTSSLLIFGDKIQTTVLTWLGVLDVGETLRGGFLLVSNAIRYVVSFLTIWLVTGMLYFFGPDAGRRRSIWPGALLGGLLWLSITAFFGWYVRNIANYNLLYGSIGAVIALCVWMWLLSLVTMIGNEFNVQTDRVRSELRHPAGA